MKFVPKAPARIPFTKEAYEKLQSEFDRLSRLREEVVVRLTTAREMGDLSENGAYHAAKMELGSIGRQLRQLKFQLRFGFVPAKNTGGTIGFGSTVTIENKDKTMTFMLVSKHESDPKQNKLSTESPIGNAVLGKKVGDEILVPLPTGEIRYKIVKVN